jgi:hypothetical protein
MHLNAISTDELHNVQGGGIGSGLLGGAIGYEIGKENTRAERELEKLNAQELGLCKDAAACTQLIERLHAPRR